MKIFATWLLLLVASLSCAAADASLQKKFALLKKMDAFVIPEINFRQTPLSDVVQILNDATISCCPNSGSINIVLMDEASAKTAVTLSLKNVSLKQALKLVASGTGLEVYVDEEAIVLRKPKKEAPTDPKTP